MTYRIARCRLADVIEASQNLRIEEYEEFAAARWHPRKEMLRLYRASVAPMAAHVDERDEPLARKDHTGVIAKPRGQIAAVWGDAAPLLADETQLWFFSTPAIEAVPLAFVHEARRWLALISGTRRIVRAHCLAHHTRTIEFWRLMGFEAGPWQHPWIELRRQLVKDAG